MTQLILMLIFEIMQAETMRSQDYSTKLDLLFKMSNESKFLEIFIVFIFYHQIDFIFKNNFYIYLNSKSMNFYHHLLTIKT